MTETVEQALRGFVVDLVESNGGLIEWPSGSDAGQAILSPQFARSAGVDEMLRFTSRPTGEGLCVNLAGDFLDTAAQWLQAVPQIGSRRLSEAYLKRGDIGEAVSRAYTWLNARVRVAGSEPTRIDYHTWWFHVLLASEDRWESRLTTTINVRAAVESDFPDPFELWELQPYAGAADIAASYNTAVAAAERRVPSLAEGFFSRMDARLERDRKRLTEYYNALRREAKQKQKRAGSEVTAEQADAGDRAVTLELRRKLAELDERYMIEATLRPLIVVRTEVPALEVRLVVQRKQAQREHLIYWNPLTKAFDPLRCTSCGRGAFSMAFTNERVEPLCSGCAR